MLLLAGEDGILRVRAVYGLDEARARAFSGPASETVFQRLREVDGEAAVDDVVAAPLVLRGTVIGMLAVWGVRSCVDAEADDWLLSALADQMAVAVESARLAEERRRDAEQLRAAQSASEARERALVTLSHDLRTPLTAIDSYSELLEMELYGPLTEEQRRALGRIRMSGRHLLSILENVLQMARLTSGIERPRMSCIDTADTLQEAKQLIAANVAARGQRLTVAGDARLRVQGDPDRLRQVLVNLLGNASKYTPAGGSIALSAGLLERAGVRWGVISVSDNGPGIAPEMLETIFQPYVRLSAEASDGSVGLGLAISRELVRQMAGDLDAISQVGRGATFRVWLRPAP
jgi:signal transduction histidine kinase